MYRAFYGVSEAPFALLHDRRFVMATAHHQPALRHLENGLSSGQALTVLLGNPGLGKTTLLKASLRSDRCRHIHCLHLGNPTLVSEPFAELLLAEFAPGVPSTPSSILDTLHGVLRAHRSRGVMAALVIDEAENLSDEGLEELAALVAMKADHTQLLPVVLAGQPALRARLDGSRLQQVQVAPPCELAPLDLAQTASYILWRIHAAGGHGAALFTREAVTLIDQCSDGVPRNISIICDNALVTGFAMKQKPITREVVVEVCRRLDLWTPPSDPTQQVGGERLESAAAAF